MPVSVAIITRDEQDRLPDCLNTLSFADEVVVVDSGSRDETVRIAKSFGCRVLAETWRGYARQKQFAVDNCYNDWVLILDADERIPVKTAENIRKLLTDPQKRFAAYGFKRKNLFHDRWIRHCGWWPDWVVRLVDRRHGCFNNNLVHESWTTRGDIKRLNLVIEHVSFRDYSDLIQKMETYSSLAALEMLKRGRQARTWSPVSHGIWMFVRTYIFELGMMEGFDGLAISLLNGGGSFLKYAKLREAKLRAVESDLKRPSLGIRRFPF